MRGGGGGIPQNALLSLTFSLPFLSPSSLGLAWRHGERGNGNGRERKHSGTTSPLCLTLPVCPPRVTSCLKCAALSTNRTPAPEFQCPSRVVRCRAVTFFQRHLFCFIHVTASDLTYSLITTSSIKN